MDTSLLVVPDTMTGWSVAFADGYVDRSRTLRQLYGEHAPNRPAHDVDIVDLARQAAAEFCNSNRDCNPHRQRGELYVLAMPRADADSAFPKAVAAQFASEAGRDYRIIATVAGQCECQAECMQRVMSAIGFTSNPQGTYQDEGGFRRDLERLAPRMMEPFIAPCMVTEKRLRRLGFTAEYDSV